MRLRRPKSTKSPSSTGYLCLLLLLLFYPVPLAFAQDAVAQPETKAPGSRIKPKSGKPLNQPTRIIDYKSVADKNHAVNPLRLHVFSPESNAEKKAPVIVFFFGGGWVGGTPKQFYPQAQYLAERGLVAIAAEYRVKNQHGTSPYECVEDGRSAIRWIRKNAESLHVDPDRVIAAGGSAGGHVAACTAVIEDAATEQDDTRVSSVPNAMILFNPVLDTTSKGYGSGRFTDQQQTELSPCHHVRPGLPPTLLFHGTADKTVPFENAERFDKLMREAGNQCRLGPFEGQGHGFFNAPTFRPGPQAEEFSDRTMQESVRFLIQLGYPVEPTTEDGNNRKSTKEPS